MSKTNMLGHSTHVASTLRLSSSHARSIPNLGSGILLVMLLSFFAVLSFTVGSAADKGSDVGAIQYIKLLALILIVLMSVTRLLLMRGGLGCILTVFKDLQLIWIYLLLCGVLLPSSFFIDISVRKLLITTLDVLCLHAILANYVMFAAQGARGLLARHMLFAFCGFALFAVTSAFAFSGLGHRIAPTAELIHPNILSSIFALGILHAFQYGEFASADRRPTIIKAIRIFVVVVGIGVIVSVFSRGTISALAASGIVFTADSVRRGRGGALFLSGCLVLLAAAVWLQDSGLVEGIVSRGQSIQNLESLTGRTLVWSAIWSALNETTILTGFGYSITFPDYSFSLSSGSIFGAHNTYVQALTSGGIIGLFVFILYLFRRFRYAMNVLAVGRANTYALSIWVFTAVNCFSESLFAATLAPPFAVFICSQTCCRIALHLDSNGERAQRRR